MHLLIISNVARNIKRHCHVHMFYFSSGLSVSKVWIVRFTNVTPTCGASVTDLYQTASGWTEAVIGSVCIARSSPTP